MTTKEKAKSYDEALDRMKHVVIVPKNEKALQALKETIFPELADSEDERIRKRIVKFIDEQYPTHGNLKEVKDKMLAYLEKQKEQKPAEDWKETRKKECPFRKEDGCERYADVVCECTGNCSWVVDYPKLKEIQDRKEQKDRLAPIYGAYC